MTEASQNFHATRPMHLASGGLIIRDEADRVLLVRPNYQDRTYRVDDAWEIPGGGVEFGEMPWEAARREVKEELNLDIVPGRLLVVDIVPGTENRLPLINFLFDGGILSTEQEASIQLDIDELSEWRYCKESELADLLEPHMKLRVSACLRVVKNLEVEYLMKQ